MTTATLPSRTSSQTYTVTLADAGGATRTCTAGSFGKPCWHVKALRIEAERAHQVAGIQRFIATYRMKRALHPADAVRLDRLIAEAERDLAALQP